MSHCFDFDGEVCVGGGVEVADGDHAYEWVVVSLIVDDRDVADFAVGHEVSGFGEGGAWGAVDDFFGHGCRDGGCGGVELFGDDSCKDVSFGDDACDVVEGVEDDEGSDAMVVHCVGGIEDGGGLRDGLGVLDTV